MGIIRRGMVVTWHLAVAAAMLGPWGAAMADDRPPKPDPRQDVTITFRYMLPNAAGAAGVDPASLVGQALASMPDIRITAQMQAGSLRERRRNSSLVQINDPRERRAWTFDETASGSDRVVSLQRHDDDVLVGIEWAAQHPEYVAERRGDGGPVAGIPCTDWSVRHREEPADDAMVVCFSADGLALRTVRTAEGMTQVTEAERVEYGPLDPALFEPPAGWPVEVVEGP